MQYAVLFDFDGVIINSPEILFKFRQTHFKEKHNVSLTRNDARALLGKTYEHQVTHFCTQHTIPITVDEYAALRNKWLPEVEAQTKLLEGITQLLVALKDANIAIGLATNHVKHHLIKELARFGILEYFDAITPKEEVTYNKPHPESYLTTAKKLGIPADHCIIIDDSPDCIREANKEGMKTVGLCSFAFSAEDFKDADLIVQSLKELSTVTLLKLFKEER